ncbi:anaerobic sulfite reductase subunit A [Geosporobacter subterraneus DSM 17957]|uniref:Anaerobic sulfite reductase subunit A n=1 Tax=Geosporobacter subterraneus DSM 17957 TaxID=1121919 RepID=A0A1M6DMI1_9FIRM|nr:anaerobic sulfite reductase subunit AsrA [Geosporobacter subterraneus]SHI74402.1 anaerobic sulfite reductase subunit A [Geosporobacter subterraneus DSM 17957]
MALQLSYEAFNKVLQELKNEYKIYAPIRLQGTGRFSDTDVVRYGEINRIEEMVIDEKAHFSPKEILFPITQTLFYYTSEEYQEPKEEDKKIIIFLRPCDIHGVMRLDQVFLKNGSLQDVYYERLREKVKFFMIECTEGFDNCFCVSMGTNQTESYSAAIRFGEELIIDFKDEELSPAFEGFGKTVDFSPEFIQKNKVEVRLPDTENIDNSLFEQDMWKEYSQRCIACGRCNFVCMTCSCWTMQDIAYEDNPNNGERRRVWAGCHVDGFTDMAGGHGFRKNYGDRMRYKTMHKIYDFKKRNGYHMCVGCGRCDDACPEYISFSNCINKVTQIVGEEQ